MISLWNSENLKRITNGEINAKWKISGISIDTRSLKKGDMFCALKGNNHDGHKYIKDAFKKGAKVALISKEINSNKQFPYLKVKDVLVALQKIAREIRLSSSARFICVTGSVGKTGTKEMLRTALEKIEKKVHANEGNFNNHIGVPLSLCRMPKKVSVCILELGMSRKGEIKNLTEICLPETAIITAIENSHLIGLKTLKKIAHAKSEILDNLPKNGCCIFNIDTNYSQLINQKAQKLKLKNIITYGKAKDANIRLENLKISGGKYLVEANAFGKKISWKMPILGEHWILNSLSALAIGHFYNYDLNKILEGVSEYKIPKGRGNQCSYKINDQIITIIDDTYNSNPASLKASLFSFKNIKSSGKKIVILGDMLELGKRTLEFHLAFKEVILETGIDILLTKGKYMKKVFKTIPASMEKYHFDDNEKIFEKFKNIINSGDLVLIKSSNSIGLNKIIENIEGNRINDL